MNSVELAKLLDQASSKVKVKLEEDLSRAKEEALSLIDDAYSKAMERASIKTKELVDRSKERVEGEKARLDVDNKRAFIDTRNFWLDRTYSRLLELVADYFKTAEYEEALANILKREVSEGVEVICSSRDVEKVNSILKELKGMKGVKVTPNDKIKGGVQLYYKEISMMKDFSIELLLKQIFESNKEKVAQILFEGE